MAHGITGARLLCAKALRRMSNELFLAHARAALKRSPRDLEGALNFVFDFHVGDFRIAPIQIRSEIRNLLARLETDRPSTVLEIGTARGGTLFLFTRVAADDATLMSVDLPGGKFGGSRKQHRHRLFMAFAHGKQRLEFLEADSHKDQTRQKIEELCGGRQVDFLFIDGDHSYEGVRRDYELYSPLVRRGGVVAVHDIAPGPRELVGGVPRFWAEIRDSSSSQELVEDWEQGGYGIGVIQVDLRDERGVVPIQDRLGTRTQP